ncbi:uncharacterized protein MKK02DRAFT_39190 [Dioszegia hungarica]|uniref:Uncharacterized protein n=1 Tax=Dioszegia hungarica TaxID=4972 RepID=A0AA38LRL3_9TREE|nr:uncharacterized protein MKK02DRAFT_39190 [Dioszegia hungarica]KAI9633210.1 hypothetical protein MKK02DRAFT_39190 [Dioszegia hungarica]
MTFRPSGIKSTFEGSLSKDIRELGTALDNKVGLSSRYCCHETHTTSRSSRHFYAPASYPTTSKNVSEGKSYHDFLKRFRGGSRFSSETVLIEADGNVPELAIGAAEGAGRVWTMYEGELRLPYSPELDGRDVPEYTQEEVLGALGKVLLKSGMATAEAQEAGKRKREAEAAVRAAKPRITKIDVAIKFACPAHMARKERGERSRRRPAALDFEDSGVHPYDVYNNDWRFSAEAIEKRILNEAKLYSENLQSIAGTAVPRYYGLWSTEVEEGTVWMMVLQLLSQPRPEDVELDMRVADLRYSTRRGICSAYTELHRANVVSRDIDIPHLLTRYDPYAAMRFTMNMLSRGSAAAIQPQGPPKFFIIDFDQAIDLAGMPEEERRKAIDDERAALGRKYGTWDQTWEDVEQGRWMIRWGDEGEDEDQVMAD